MSTLSALKNTFISAIKSPHQNHKPRSRQRVISFKDALENIKTSQTGFVTCAAFHSFGKCRKEIALFDSNFPANLDQLNMADIQTPIKLMPLMLCSTHWEKTVYHNALFLDWLSTYGSGQDNQHYENIVIDYESAIAIDNEEHSLLDVTLSSKSVAGNQGTPASVPHSPAKEDIHANCLQTTDPLQVHRDHDKTTPPEPESPIHRDQNLPEISVLVSAESYASIELGVAKIEILYQENLKCIAMTSNGWRCEETIHEDQLLKARELLSSSAASGAELDIGLLPQLILCSGHALGEIPRAYSERWTTFEEKRLPKEVAMSRFSADSWMSVQFFPNERTDEPVFPTTSNRPRSSSNVSAHGTHEYDSVGCGRAESGTLSRRPIRCPIETPQDPKRYEFGQDEYEWPKSEQHESESSLPHSKFTTTPGNWDLPRCRPLFATCSADNPSIGGANLETSPTESHPVLGPTPTLKLFSPSNNSENGASTTSDLGATDTSVTMSKVFTNLELTDDHLQPVADASSVSKIVVEEPIQLEDQMGAQNVQSGKITTPSLSGEAAQPPIQNYSQDIIDSNLLKEMSSPIPQGGCVYISKSLDGKLVKIGRKAIDVNSHKQQIQAGCQLQDLDQVEVQSVHVKNPERVAKLVHLELQNFRAKNPRDSHQHVPSSEPVGQGPSEWFDVSESVAIKSVELWRDFVDQAYTSEGTIKENWARALTLLPKPSSSEIRFLGSSLGVRHEDDIVLHHWLRHDRYRNWMLDEKSRGHFRF